MSTPVAGFERRGQMQDAGGGERRRRERMVSGIRELCGVAGALFAFDGAVMNDVRELIGV
jgi:hypothetical protein